jgi:hypothetical protein
MRYLKLFEAFTADDYYQEQMDEEFAEIPTISMSDKYVSMITNMFNKYKSSRNLNNPEVEVMDTKSGSSKTYIRITNPLHLNVPVYDKICVCKFWE